MANDWRETVDEVLWLHQDSDFDTAPGPALQWYPAQWLGDAAVQLMSLEAEGAHHRLLMLAWKGLDLDEDPVPCSIPDDVELLGDVCRADPERWPRIWRQVSRGWRRHQGRLWNLGLCREYVKQMGKRLQSKRNADARWAAERKRAAAQNGDANAQPTDANAGDLQCSSSSSSSSSSIPDKKEEREAGDTLPGVEPTEPEPKKARYQEEVLMCWRYFQDVALPAFKQRCQLDAKVRKRDVPAPNAAGALTTALSNGYTVDDLKVAMKNAVHHKWLRGEVGKGETPKVSLETWLKIRPRSTRNPIDRVGELIELNQGRRGAFEYRAR